MKQGKWRFLTRRVGFYLATAWSAITLNFLIPRLMPGDPASVIVRQLQRQSGESVSPETVAAIQKLFGDPRAGLLQQYGDYLASIARLDFGLSVSRFPTPVGELLGAGLPWTLLLVGTTTVVAFLLGTGLGIAAGWKPGGRLDGFLSPMSTFLSALPYFWVALIALYVFGLVLGWFPLGGGFDPDLYGGPGFLGSVLEYLVMPAATIVFSAFGGWLLGMRNMMVTAVSEDYVLLGRAKGLSAGRVMFRYAARNALLPSVTGFAMAIGGVLGGALLTEIVFSYPGIGYLLYDAVSKRDYPLMQGVFLLTTLTVLLANFVADSVYVMIDPRTREAGR
ncbi:ABC transporter permease [Nonomuraea bangladeshensis]|uniref:ABC transporter permease n=1 Tax=Nonomuraea bangladeshensis TaxID=404385 RepID=A0ABV3GVZ2_9ACTN